MEKNDLRKQLAALTPEQLRVLEQRLQQRQTGSEAPAKPTAAARSQVTSGFLESSASEDKWTAETSNQPVEFSLFYFSSDGSGTGMSKYALLLETAKFADKHGFSAIWIPERHLQNFGGLYPNPSVLAASLAMATERIQIRSGSVVLPLHHPLRVAEEWAMVDNLSGGRVGLSAASGWYPLDFVIRPETYDRRREITFEDLQTIRRLWAGETVRFRGVHGTEADVKLLPRPVQAKLPVWITSSGSPETWIKAGELGTNVLGALIAQSPDELARRIDLYREARARHGYDQGKVTIMLHTFIGTDNDTVRGLVREPLQEYLRSFLGQHRELSPEQRWILAGPDGVDSIGNMSEEDREALVQFSFDRYFQSSSLLGTPEKCVRVVERLRAIGVNEIACLVDSGLALPTVLEGLQHLSALRDRFVAPPPESVPRRHDLSVRLTRGSVMPMALTVGIYPRDSMSERITRPIGRYIPLRYHSYLKIQYRRITQVPICLYLRRKYFEGVKKITRRVFSYTPVQLENKLITMGITAGDTLLMHSAFNVFNGFNGTPDQVIDCILNIIGDSGNLAMVSMPYTGSTAAYLQAGLAFDVKHTMSAMGVITEIFRQKPGVVRSVNPAHPILALGPAAQGIIAGHEKTMYSCGKESPFEKMVHLQAKALFFDVSLGSMTFFHYLEDLFQEMLPVKLYDDNPIESIVIDGSGNKKTAKTYVFSSESKRYRNIRGLQKSLIKKKLIKLERLGIPNSLSSSCSKWWNVHSKKSEQANRSGRCRLEV